MDQTPGMVDTGMILVVQCGPKAVVMYRCGAIEGAVEMTPETRGKDVVESFVRCVERRQPWDAVVVIGDAIRAAVAEERERCAKLADSFCVDDSLQRGSDGWKIAAAIRGLDAPK